MSGLLEEAEGSPKHQNQNVHVQDWDVVIVRSLFVKLVGKIMNIKKVNK